MSSDETRKVVQTGGVNVTSPEGEELQITSEELVEKKAKEGFIRYGLTVALNTDITPELEQEGWVREVVRAPGYAEEAGPPIEKRVNLTLDADEELKVAITAFEDVARMSCERFDGQSEGMER